MSKTLISSSLLKKTLDHFNDAIIKFQSDDVIRKSIPVLFFGDIQRYLQNDFKIVTAALNPSDMEFKLDKSEKRFSHKFRFEDFDGSHESLETAYSNYFKKHPYDWFGKRNNKHLNIGFKPVLNGLGYCFYPNKNDWKAVLHTDVCSPIATKKKWSDLDSEIKIELFKNGFPLWKELIKEIKPNLIIMSIAKDIINMLDPLEIENIYSKSNRFEVNLYEINIDGFITNLVWASAQHTPFQPFSNKFEIGEMIKKKFDLKKGPK